MLEGSSKRGQQPELTPQGDSLAAKESKGTNIPPLVMDNPTFENQDQSAQSYPSPFGSLLVLQNQDTLMVGLVVAGLLLCFLGHRFFKLC